MEAKTRVFGDIIIDDDKVLTFAQGIIGYPELRRFALLHDMEQETVILRWLQSLEDPDFALPVINPLLVREDYDPVVEDSRLESLGALDQENLLVLVTVSMPEDLTKMSVNLQGPIIINSLSCKGCQLIVEGEEYPVRYPIYDKLKARKEG